MTPAFEYFGVDFRFGFGFGVAVSEPLFVLDDLRPCARDYCRDSRADGSIFCGTHREDARL